MKSLLVTVICAAFTITGYAQNGKYGANPTDSSECRKALSVMQSFMKQKDIKSAYPHWKTAYTLCPAASKNIYIYGVKIFKDRIKNAKDAGRKKELADSLYMIYDSRVQHFGKACYVNGRKGMDMQRYSPDEVEMIYNTLKSSVDECGEKSEAYVISSYYKALYDMYKEEKADKEALLTEYVKLTKLVDANLTRLQCDEADKKCQKKRGYYEGAMDKMNQVFFRVAECPEIEEIITKMMSENQGDVEVCKSALKILNKKGCDGSDIYRQVAECVHKDQPTHESGYSLGIIYAKKKQFSQALDYMKEAIELCTDCPDKEKYLEKAGQTASAMGSVSQVRSFANQLLKLNPNNGEAYILIGNSIASKNCDDPVQKWAVNWLAYDYYAKAKALDSGAAAKAQQRMNSCAARFPTKSEVFFHELKPGDKVQVTCGGLNESTTVRVK